MGLLSTEVEVTLNSATIKHYEALGYEIPRIRNKHRKISVPRGTKIKVKFEDIQKYSNILLDVECDYCGKQYKIYNPNYQKLNREGKIYCDACSKKIFRSGINHPLYNPNITQEEREKGRIYPEYTDFVKRVLARDNYTCQCCGKTRDEVDLNVHHLDSYNWCIEKRTDDTNGITLCETCHSNFHLVYGRGGNTKEQFEEWYQNALPELSRYDGALNRSRKIYCYEEDKIYNSAREFEITHHLSTYSHIYDVCNNKNRRHSIIGLHLFWYDEYLKMNTDKIEKRVVKQTRPDSKRVICLTTNKIYLSIAEGVKNEQVSHTSIVRCCRHERSYVTTKDGRTTQWMFYDEYLNQLEESV